MTLTDIRQPGWLMHHGGFLVLALFFLWSTSLAQNLGQQDFAAGNGDAYQGYTFKNAPDWRAAAPETDWRTGDPVFSGRADRFQVDDPGVFDEMARGEANNARGDRFRAVDPAPAMRLRLRF